MSHLRYWRPGIRQTSFKNSPSFSNQSCSRCFQNTASDLQYITMKVPPQSSQKVKCLAQGHIGFAPCGVWNFRLSAQNLNPQTRQLDGQFWLNKQLYRLKSCSYKGQVRQFYLTECINHNQFFQQRRYRTGGWSQHSHINLHSYGLRLGLKGWDKQSC